MALSKHDGDLVITGSLSANSMNYPAVSINNADIGASAAIAASKLVHRHAVRFSLGTSTTVSSFNENIFVASAAGIAQSFEVSPEVSPTGGDVYKVDLQKGNSASTFVSVLSAVVSISSDTNDRTVQAGSITTTSFADGDLYRVVSETTSAAGTMGTGLCCMLKLDENPS